MEHDLEFQEPATSELPATTKDLAAAYARVFLGSEDGKRVLKHLRIKFGTHRLCFASSDTIAAAITDGERRVMLHIDGALALGAPDQGLLR